MVPQTNRAAQHLGPIIGRSRGEPNYASGVYVVVCRGPNCRARGSLPLRNQLARLLKQEPGVHVLGYSCLGQCDFGPNVAFYPDGEWYGGLNQPNDAQRIVRHAMAGEPMAQPPLQVPSAERAEHMRNIEELVMTLLRDRARVRKWWWPF